MVFKVDFKKIHDNWWNGLTKEEQDRITLRKKLENENTFYKTTILLDDEYSMKNYGKEKKEAEQEVKLYRPVSSDNTVKEKVLICFGGYRQYEFDRRFVKRMTERLSDPSVRFCIDIGGEVYVKNSEMKRILAECIESLKCGGVELVCDYDEEFTNSSMGKMIASMGLR